MILIIYSLICILLNLIEKDETLLALYRKCVKDSWNVHKEDKIMV